MSTFPDIENRTYKNVQVLEYRKVFPVVKMKLFHSAAEWQKNKKNNFKSSPGIVLSG